MPFVFIPANQVQAKPKKSTSGQRGRPLGTSPNISKVQKNNSTASRTTVTVAAYGAKLFEPIMTREKPIYVHFLDFIIRDSDAITRFSEDGFFAIKVFLTKTNNKTRCYLAHFHNPISATPEHNLMLACQEAVDYAIFEFDDDDEYVLAAQRKDREGLSPQDAVKFRSLSALGQAEQKIIEILRDKIIAEKFLKRQKEYEKQNQEWKDEFARQLKRQEEEEEDIGVWPGEEKENKDADLETSDSQDDEFSVESEVSSELQEIKEDKEVLQEAGEETLATGSEGSEVLAGAESKVATSKPLVWGFGRKK